MGSVRIDRWLWSVRLTATRADATAACAGGHVHVGARIAKPATHVSPGDRIDVRLHGRQRIVEVVRPIDKRGRCADRGDLLHRPHSATRRNRADGTRAGSPSATVAPAGRRNATAASSIAGVPADVVADASVAPPGAAIQGRERRAARRSEPVGSGQSEAEASPDPMQGAAKARRRQAQRAGRERPKRSGGQSRSIRSGTDGVQGRHGGAAGPGHVEVGDERELGHARPVPRAATCTRAPCRRTSRGSAGSLSMTPPPTK